MAIALSLILGFVEYKTSETPQIIKFSFPTFDKTNITPLSPPTTHHELLPSSMVAEAEYIAVKKEIIRSIKIEPKSIDNISSCYQESFTPEIHFHDSAISDIPVESFPTDSIFIFVSGVPASFPGGFHAMQLFIQKNIRYPRICRRQSIDGKVYVRFVVERNGSLSKVEVVRGVVDALDAEAVRVISAMPNWLPARQRGQTVRHQMILPIDFRLR